MFDKTSTLHTPAELPSVSEKAATIMDLFALCFGIYLNKISSSDSGTLVNKMSPPVSDILPSQTSTIAYKSDRSFLRIDQNIVRRMTLASLTFPPPFTGSSSP